MNILENMEIPSDFEQLKNFQQKLIDLAKLMEDFPNVDDAMKQNAFNKNIEIFKKLTEQNLIDIFSHEGELKDNIYEGLKIYMELFYEYAEIAVNHRLQLEKEGKLDPLSESKKTVSKIHPVEGKLHKLLGLKPEETIKSKYKSGEDLYKAIARKIKDHSKVTGMLAYAANINKEKDVFDSALHYAKKINAKKD